MRSDLLKNAVTHESIKEEDYILSFARGLSLLEVFGIERQKFNVTQIAERTDLSRTAARRYLKTLKFLGYLDSDEHYFWLTHKVLRFSSSYLSSSHLTKISQPLLNMLSTETTLTYSVGVLDENEVVPIARSYLPFQENLRVSPYGMHLGNRLPAHATSTGKVLLAALNSNEQKAWFDKHGLKRLTPHTIQDETLFYNELQQVSQQDFCLSKEEHELGILAVAVPILDSKAKPIAALNCMAQIHRVTDEHLIQKILPLLQNTAYEIRAMI